jgi:hypothetical protein
MSRVQIVPVDCFPSDFPPPDAGPRGSGRNG